MAFGAELNDFGYVPSKYIWEIYVIFTQETGLVVYNAQSEADHEEP